MSWVSRLGLKLFHYARRDSLAGSRRNIADHYDLGNDFFQLFLDPTMMYSSGVFSTPSDSMEQASINKMSMICEKLALTSGDHLLEIGAGWGSLAMHAAEHYGCHVTTTTISSEQYEHAKSQVEAADLSEMVTVLKSDYRELVGTYDKLVSIEMIEAVGEKYLDKYFNTIKENLAPGGRGAIQAIIIKDELYDRYRNKEDFIQKYIFPGGFLPSVESLNKLSDKSGLKIDQYDLYGTHYSNTLQKWRERFLNSWDLISKQGFNLNFKKMWNFYFSYCEAGFKSKNIDLIQFSLCNK